MTDNVVSLRGGPMALPAGAADANIVASLKDLLAKAEAGEITCLIVGWMTPDPRARALVRGNLTMSNLMMAQKLLNIEVDAQILPNVTREP